MDVRNRLFEREYGYAPSHPPNACGCDFCDCGACDSEIPLTVVVPLAVWCGLRLALRLDRRNGSRSSASGNSSASSLDVD